MLAPATAHEAGTLARTESNRLAARRLRPNTRKGPTNSSQLGHALVIEMVERGLIDAELTTAVNGTPMVARVLHPCSHGHRVSRSLAA